MPTKNFNKLPIQIIALVTIAIAIIGCGVFPSARSSAAITSEECTSDKSFVYVPAGDFISGSDRQERDYAYRISAESIADTDAEIKQAERKLRKTGWFDGESARQTSSLPGFCISRNLVTNQDYQEFIQATNYQAPGISEADYQKQGFLVHPYSKVKEFLWTNNTYPPNTAQKPVVLISYQDALAYADWREKTEAAYRLPTAEEWEKAARGEDGRYFPWGNDWQNQATNSATSELNYTSEIGKFPLSKSVYGVEDMAGNVFEYTSSLKYDDTRVTMKGCGWDDLPGFCRAAYEHTRPINSRHILFGFRLVKK
ncbi:formylglycine-generating enzyme family protein [Pleurocapsa sp. FMAR1]|uniref:formylglycine-generating enzyme family protein n=1 Tax=Pleurocapsa sp. FMAR1 TaxID=3040204 RepID=UPI0029C6329D|nr:formylglycine-generating enzyme family protein [Pleurocapsa sp. FMAR1]